MIMEYKNHLWEKRSDVECVWAERTFMLCVYFSNFFRTHHDISPSLSRPQNFDWSFPFFAWHKNLPELQHPTSIASILLCLLPFFCTMISVVILFSSSVVYFLRPPCPERQIEWLIKKTKISRTEKKRRVRKVVKLPTTVSEWGVQHTDDEPFTVNVHCSLHYPRPSMEIETVKRVKRLTASNGIFVTFAVIDDFYHNYGSRQWEDRFLKEAKRKKNLDNRSERQGDKRSHFFRHWHKSDRRELIWVWVSCRRVVTFLGWCGWLGVLWKEFQ